MSIAVLQRTNNIKYPEIEPEDPLSSLPNELLAHIFSSIDTESEKATFKLLNKKTYCIANNELTITCEAIKRNDHILDNIRNNIYTLKKLPFSGDCIAIRIIDDRLFTGMFEGDVRIWNLTSQRHQQTIKGKNELTYGFGPVLSEHPVTKIARQADKVLCLTGSINERIDVIDFNTSKLVPYDPTTSEQMDVNFENDHRFLTSSGLVHIFSDRSRWVSEERAKLTRVQVVSLHIPSEHRGFFNGYSGRTQALCFHQGQVYVGATGAKHDSGDFFVLDYTVTKKESLDQIADLFEIDPTMAWGRFNDEISEEDKNQIYGCLYRVMKEKAANFWEKNGNYWKCAEDAFHNKNQYHSRISNAHRGEAIKKFANQ